VPAVPRVLGVSKAHNSRSATCSGACRRMLLVVTLGKTQASEIEGFAVLPWPALLVLRTWAMSSSPSLAFLPNGVLAWSTGCAVAMPGLPSNLKAVGWFTCYPVIVSMADDVCAM